MITPTSDPTASLTSLFHNFHTNYLSKEIGEITVEKFKIPAYNIQAITVFFYLDQMNSKECLHFQLSNAITVLFVCLFLPPPCFAYINDVAS